MIVTVTLNAALDVTYRIDQVDWNGVNRVQSPHRRAGGKGVNVARVLAALGHDVLVLGLAGGPTGQALAIDLTASALPHALTAVDADSRTTLTVTGLSGTTLFNEPGPLVTPEELGRFLDGFDEALTGAAAVVLSGSLPRGVPADFYATLAARAADRGIPALVDADGEALRHAPTGRPSIVKPNLEELARASPPGPRGPNGRRS
ncbi:1-phosphofructokinase family hexose kinase [Streptosporangium lutulentum]